MQQIVTMLASGASAKRREMMITCSHLKKKEAKTTHKNLELAQHPRSQKAFKASNAPPASNHYLKECSF